METSMAKEKIGIFKLLQGLKPVDPNVLKDFEREMTEQVIPKIVQDVEKRRMLAAESRHWRLERPKEEEPPAQP
jgi:hypothetical protein